MKHLKNQWTKLLAEQNKDLSDLDRLQELLGYRFEKINLLLEAITHKSCLVGDFSSLPWNERLEFLGDAVLSLAVSQKLWFLLDKESSEGVLSRNRSMLVNESSLAAIAKRIQLGDFIFLSKAEKQQDPEMKRDSLLADTLEAILGAIFLDAGFETACHVLAHLFGERLSAIETNQSKDFIDHKTMLQEIIQAKSQQTPKYVDIGASGPDHKRIFEVSVIVEGKSLGRGFGLSKKKASQKAAEDALSFILKGNNQHDQQIENI